MRPFDCLHQTQFGFSIKILHVDLVKKIQACQRVRSAFKELLALAEAVKVKELDVQS